MIVKKSKILILLSLLLGIFSISYAQLIINEISQGPSGAKEYIELLVVGQPTCSSIPCIDLRGFYIDDNNGSFASGAGTGIAQGCIRFTNNSFWSCIPVGTIIVVYNDADINASIPADDISITDGNCKLIIPVSNCNLLEENTSFPNTAVNTYPTAGFTSCGNWSSLAMANSDDSFQTLTPNGNSIFSVSWGNNTTNSIIYFNGSTAANVAIMANIIDNNPNNQANWIKVSTAGNQTPGDANNTANADWINTMNNACSVITPLILSTSSTDASCACDGAATVVASGAIAPYTYIWSNTINNTATATGLCGGSYSLTVTSSNGCTETATAIIMASTVLNISANSASICNGQLATLTATGGVDYLWSNGNTASSITVSPSTTTTYTLSGTNGSCSGTASATVFVAPTPVINVNSETICEGDTATLTVGGANSYLWSTGNTTNSISETPLTNASYTVTGTSNGCSISTTAVINVNLLPTVSFTANTIAGCEAFCTQFTDLSNVSGDSIVSWNWNFGDNKNSDNQFPEHCFTSQGKYSIKLTVGSQNGCYASFTDLNMITLEAMPEAIFEVPSSISSFDPNVSFTNNSIGGDYWKWDFNDPYDSINNTSNLENPNHNYSNAGKYCATLEITNNLGCVDTNQQCFVINSETIFYVPNTFSPNGDGINDAFFCKGENIIEFEMHIYNRWGKLIFETNNINDPWNGKHFKSNEMSPEDSYIYVITFVDKENEKYQYKGKVTVIR